MRIIYSNNEDGYVLSEVEKPCFICGKLTNQIEIHFECRVCSDECCIKLCNEYLFNSK